jgi:intron-binding protein aquarius
MDEVSNNEFSADSFAISNTYKKLIRISLIQDSKTSSLYRLEQSSYLERVLLPTWNAESSSDEHLLSICALFIEKASRDNGVKGGDGSSWHILASSLSSRPEVTETPEQVEKRTVRLVSALIIRASLLLLTSSSSNSKIEDEKNINENSKKYNPSVEERCLLLSFVSKGFLSLEVSYVRKAILRLVSIPIWQSLSPNRLDLELLKSPSLKRPFAKVCADALLIKSKIENGGGLVGRKRARVENTTLHSPSTLHTTPSNESMITLVCVNNEEEFSLLQKRMDSTFIPALISTFLNLLEMIPSPKIVSNSSSTNSNTFQPDMAQFCILVLELFMDLLSQLPTRRFVKVLLQDAHLILLCRKSNLIKYAKNTPSLFRASLSSSSSPSSTLSVQQTRSELVSSSAGIAVGSEMEVSKEDEDEEDEDEQLVTITETLDPSSPAVLLGKTFNQLVDAVAFYLDFEVDDESGKAKTILDVEAEHYTRVSALQSLAFKFFASSNRTMKEFALGSTSLVSSPHTLKMFLSSLTLDQIVRLAANLRVLPIQGFIAQDYQDDHDKSPWIDPLTLHINKQHSVSLSRPPKRSFVLSILLDYCVRRISQLKSINDLSLYPSEELLWDANLLPSSSSSSSTLHSLSIRENEATISSSSSSSLVIPKLNLQFLTIYDYLLRCFHLYRLESSYSIRSDLVDAIRRSAPRLSPSTRSTTFTGWSKMAVTINGAQVTSVLPPKIGGQIPSGVLAEVTFDLQKFAHHIRAEWNSIREHDVLFLVSIQAVIPQGVATTSSPTFLEDDASFARNVGVTCVRGCEVYQILDEKGDVFNDSTVSNSRGGDRGSGYTSSPVGTRRTLRVRLDPAHYFTDCEERSGSQSTTKSFYSSSFNLLVRRDVRANNFKAVLQTIRDVMNSSAQGGAVPEWFLDILLGYGDPSDVHYTSLPKGIRVDRADFGYTFSSAAHLVSSFPTKTVIFRNDDGDEIDKESSVHSLSPPFRLVFEDESNTVIATSYSPLPSSMSSLISTSHNQKQQNVLFTPNQVEALRSALNPGLTLVVGPPGTGKTDTVVQALNLLYQNFPTQKVLIVTHSNQALNDIFEKLIKNTNIPQRHLLRLGSGERELDVENDFTKTGRVQAMLERREVCLSEVERLGKSLDIQGDVGYTCETASFFFAHHIKARIDSYRKLLRIPSPPTETADLTSATAYEAAHVYRKELATRTSEIETGGGRSSLSQIVDSFPFTKYFSTHSSFAITPISNSEGTSSSNTMSAALSDTSTTSALDCIFQAESRFAFICGLFDEIASLRAFELLRSQRARSDYMLTKQARIVAMTCTHASIMRSRFIALDFKFDSIIMEEAAQVLEIETLIPILLQKGMALSNRGDKDEGVSENDQRVNSSTSLLKRVVLVGDHNQLPPIVQNSILARHARLEQSMFARFIRLGVVPITLSAQGRSRPSIAKLYSWRYGGLENLPAVTKEGSSYSRSNAGFIFDHQLVNVEDYHGEGETSPSPYFFQNLGEAEYVVAVYQYMRLLGYSANSIVILTTYNGQKALIKDVIARRCANFPIFGEPGKIETVDAFQGQQADYVLLSLVRTKFVGHLRDIRRLVVALSRARLGLFIFCRKALFSNCPDLSTAFSLLSSRPTDLQLLLGEMYPSLRGTEEENVKKACESTNGLLMPITITRGPDQMGEIVSAILKAKESEVAR